ncbi:SRPBCC family protein [Microbacteriaceae bacterium VKM Ac-2854]|nr:SRPBCC family protein [Microbacteriaceae bacterium VKM Ac-2854]
MSQIIETIDVSVPVSAAYNQWTQFEEFPKFLDEVESIQQITETLTVWKVKVGPVEREFEAKITEQHPDERVAWTSTGGETDHAGVVTFHKLSETETRVTVQLDWEPTGLLEKLGSAVGAGSHAVKKDLKNFKEYIEAQGAADGAWRGDVQA